MIKGKFWEIGRSGDSLSNRGAVRTVAMGVSLSKSVNWHPLSQNSSGVPMA